VTDTDAVLATEAAWLETAHANSAGRGYSDEYRRGFAAAAGWVRLHAEMDSPPHHRPPRDPAACEHLLVPRLAGLWRCLGCHEDFTRDEAGALTHYRWDRP